MIAHAACPCSYVEPCQDNCTCAHPHLSGGCLRCCSYGSHEQRVAAARRLTRPPLDEAMIVRIAQAAWITAVSDPSHGGCLQDSEESPNTCTLYLDVLDAIRAAIEAKP